MAVGQIVRKLFIDKSGKTLEREALIITRVKSSEMSTYKLKKLINYLKEVFKDEQKFIIREDEDYYPDKSSFVFSVRLTSYEMTRKEKIKFGCQFVLCYTLDSCDELIPAPNGCVALAVMTNKNHWERIFIDYFSIEEMLEDKISIIPQAGETTYGN